MKKRSGNVISPDSVEIQVNEDSTLAELKALFEKQCIQSPSIFIVKVPVIQQWITLEEYDT